MKLDGTTLAIAFVIYCIVAKWLLAALCHKMSEHYRKKGDKEKADLWYPLGLGA